MNCLSTPLHYPILICDLRPSSSVFWFESEIVSRHPPGCNYKCITFRNHQNSGWWIRASTQRTYFQSNVCGPSEISDLFTFLSVYKPHSLPSLFKRLLYYLFSRVLTHNGGLHASDWFIPPHCFTRVAFKIPSFSRWWFTSCFFFKSKWLQQIQPVDRHFLPGGTWVDYPTIFPFFSRIKARFTGQRVDIMECVPANLIGLCINYRPEVSIICSRELYWFYCSTT